MTPSDMLPGDIVVVTSPPPDDNVALLLLAYASPRTFTDEAGHTIWCWHVRYLDGPLAGQNDVFEWRWDDDSPMRVRAERLLDLEVVTG